MDNANILVTGATGFIGSHLAEELIQRGERVRCLVKRDNFEKDGVPLLKRIGAQITYGDLLDKGSIKDALAGVDKVYHMAAIARPMPIPDEEYFRVNVMGTKNLLEACKDAQVKRIVHASSISAVGPAPNRNPMDEKTACNPITVYGRSKLSAENVAIECFEIYRTPVIIIRYDMVFGPRDLVTLNFFKAVNTGLFPVLGAGMSRIEFTYVKNLIPGIISAMEKGRPGEIYHLNNGETYRIREVYEAIAKAEMKKLIYFPVPVAFFYLLGRIADKIEKLARIKLPFNSITVRGITSDLWVINTDKAKRELAFRPDIPLQQGIDETVAWYKENGYL